MLVCILGNVKGTKPWCEMAFPGRKEERAQRRLTSSPSGKKLHYKSYMSTILRRKETKDILEDSNSTMIKKSKLNDRMMALCSHCHLGLSVKPSAMSPTLQLSTFIKRLKTPPLTHWQDWGWPADGARPFVQ